MTFDPYGIHLGTLLYLRYYGLILVSGAFAGGYLASLEARRRGMNPELVWDAILWALVGGIVGARLWHILTPPPSMAAAGLTTAGDLTHPLVITDQGVTGALALWNGGRGAPSGPGRGPGGLLVHQPRPRCRCP